MQEGRKGRQERGLLAFVFSCPFPLSLFPSFPLSLFPSFPLSLFSSFPAFLLSLADFPGAPNRPEVPRAKRALCAGEQTRPFEPLH